MAKFYVKDVVCDYGIFDDKDDLRHTMILNSRRNAELIADIMNVDEEHKIFEFAEIERLKNEVSYYQKLSDLSDLPMYETLRKENESLKNLVISQGNRISDLEQELEEYEDFNDYEEPEIKLTDKYYAFCTDRDKEYGSEFVWTEKIGIKEEFLGREIFSDGYNRFTDGITGILADKKLILKLPQEKLDTVMSGYKDLEEKYGKSPLYTDNPKYPIKPYKVRV